MGKIEEIYGIKYKIPDEPNKTEIDGHNLPKKEQKFREVVIPSHFEERTTRS